MGTTPLSVTIITLNEEHNIERAIKSVGWADEVVVVDSGSSDRTVQLAQALGARVLHNPWPGYGQQKNFAQNQAAHDWVLNLDADEAVSVELADEIRAALQNVSEKKLTASAFSVPRKTFYVGKWIRFGGWYPNTLVRLVDRRRAGWTEPNVHEALRTNGEIIPLRHPLLHFAFPTIEEQIVTNLRFSRLGAEDLKRAGRSPNLIKLLFKPIGKFIETYIIKRGFLDGIRGLIISVNAAHSMFLKYAYLFEARMLEETKGDTDARSDNR